MPRRKEHAPEPVSVLLISRVRLYRDAIIALLRRHPGIHATGSADLGSDLPIELEAPAPDVVLLDMGSPGAAAFAASMVKERPRTRILGFGVDDVDSGSRCLCPGRIARLCPCVRFNFGSRQRDKTNGLR